MAKSSGATKFYDYTSWQSVMLECTLHSNISTSELLYRRYARVEKYVWGRNSFRDKTANSCMLLGNNEFL